MKLLLSFLTLSLIIIAAILLTNHPYKKYLPASLDQKFDETVNQEKQQAQDYLEVKKNEIKEEIKAQAKDQVQKSKVKLLTRLKNTFWEGIDQGRALFNSLFK